MSIEVMRRALEALEWNYNTDLDNIPACEQWAKMLKKNITALRQAIEQAQQAEPDYYGLTKDHLWMSITKDHYDRLKPEFRMACYTSPPLRQPLTENEIKHLWYEACQTNLELTSQLIVHLARNIEAAHGIGEQK